MQLGAIVKPLLAIGPLIRGSVVCRPSKTIRSPYVADVKLADGSTVIAHTPALDVGGLMSPGAEVWMKVRPPGGKTSHSVELVTCKGPECGPEGKALVGAHPRLAELVTKKLLETAALPFGGRDNETVRSQVTLGDSRVDYVIENSDSDVSDIILEVKNVVCADYHTDTAPAKINANHCVVTSSVPAEDYKRFGIFPWGRVGQEFEGKKVVSERAIKHLRNLAKLEKKGEDAKVLFVVSRGDCDGFRACHEQCPVFAEELGKAHSAGVDVLCAKVHWNTSGDCFYDGMIDVAVKK
ncbi:hypothetical protein TrRE_jg7538 [Triparma retinervis]|uniref:Sugar fermentation stimulation protein C-terminal domain-containing protein n=1 Tax=Triparma retinervis TaxID=2557542 RepID=A0A9W7AF54_9STRA|nr:hypothetical protein TrRE_jg7538 [Triparma retinervis]